MIKFVPLKCKIKKLRIHQPRWFFFNWEVRHNIQGFNSTSTLGVAPTIRLDGAYLIINSGVKNW